MSARKTTRTPSGKKSRPVGASVPPAERVFEPAEPVVDPILPSVSDGGPGAKRTRLTHARKRPPAGVKRAAAGATVSDSAAPAEALKALHAPEVAVYPIHFEPSQRASLDPAFIPLDNAGRVDPLFEFAVFERLAADDGVRLAPMWGAVSWRFGAKTGLTGQQWLDQMRQLPGADVYFCNPSPENEGLYASPWQQGVAKHPRLKELAGQVVACSGIDARELEDILPSQAFSSCNYFVGNARFWELYLPFVRGVVEAARRRLPAAVLAELDSSKADPMGLHPGATYWPFIVERLFTLFLNRHAGEVKAQKIPLPALEARLNAHLKRLREMKDVAHRTRSQWLYGCWLNYRNLYLLHAAGKEWCARHLPALVSKEVRFG